MMKRATRHVLFSFILMCCLCSTLHAQQKWQTSKHLEMAREALALGEMEKWEKALKLADKAFELEKTRMSFSERNNQKLWITLFWSKYHQFKGTLPPIKQARDFENTKSLDEHTDKVEKAIGHLQKGMRYLRTYNLMYMQVAQRSNLQNQIYLQASLSLERDLQGTIRQGKIYAAFLRFVKQNWSDKKAIKGKLQSQSQALTALRKRQKSSEDQQNVLKKEQTKLAVVVQKAQASYEIVQQNLNRQASTATALIWGGAIAMAVGAGGLGTGIYFISDAEARRTTLSPAERQQINDTGFYIAIASTAVLVLGAAALLTGIVVNPGSTARSKAVLGSHNKYLDVERNKLKPTSSLWSPFKKIPSGKSIARTLPPPSPKATVTLGSW